MITVLNNKQRTFIHSLNLIFIGFIGIQLARNTFYYFFKYKFIGNPYCILNVTRKISIDFSLKFKC